MKALPIGIPYDRFASLANTSPRAWAATGALNQPNAYIWKSFSPCILGHPRVVLGVDRLDYTKGLVSRLKSFRRLLEKYPKWIEKVILLQVTHIPSSLGVFYISIKHIDKPIYRQFCKILISIRYCINRNLANRTPLSLPIYLSLLISQHR